MLPAPETTPRERLEVLVRRWESEERAIATVLGELEDDREELQRELAFSRIVGECRPDLDLRWRELHGECEALATELAHIRLAVAGARVELQREQPWLERLLTPPAHRAG